MHIAAARIKMKAAQPSGYSGTMGFMRILQNSDAKPTHLISHFGKEIVAPHQIAVYRSVISQHTFAVQIDFP
jgi:hypothetical protein